MWGFYKSIKTAAEDPYQLISSLYKTAIAQTPPINLHVQQF